MSARAWQNVAAAALVLAAFSLLASVYLSTALRKEGEQRRDQACRIDERKQQRDVDRLRDTYRYLLRLTPRQLSEAQAGRGALLNRAIIANLAKTEADALEDDAAAFCDEPGVGLPEPDERAPERPRVLR